MGRRSCHRRLEADGTGQDVVYVGVGMLAGEGLGSGPSAVTGTGTSVCSVVVQSIANCWLLPLIGKGRSSTDSPVPVSSSAPMPSIVRPPHSWSPGDDEQGVGVLGDVLACTASRQGLAERGDVGSDPIRALTVHGVGGTLVDDDAAVTQHAAGGRSDAVRVVHARTSCDDDQHGEVQARENHLGDAAGCGKGERAAVHPGRDNPGERTVGVPPGAPPTRWVGVTCEG